MAQFFRPDVHQQVFSIGIFAIESLNRILKRSSELAIGTTELL